MKNVQCFHRCLLHEHVKPNNSALRTDWVYHYHVSRRSIFISTVGNNHNNINKTI